MQAPLPLVAALLAAALGLAAAPAGLALFEAPAKSGQALKVSSPAFRSGGEMPPSTSQYGDNRFPGLTWTPVAGAKSYVLVMQDSDAPLGRGGLVHCIVFDISGDAASLPAGMMSPPTGARYGGNYLGGQPPYAGPRPPPGPKHHYHFQVFALDAALPDSASAGLDALTAAMRGHVLASGEVVGLGGAPG